MKKIITALAASIVALCLCPMAFAEEEAAEVLLVTNQSESVSENELTPAPHAEDEEIIEENDEEEIVEEEDLEEEEVEPQVWPAILVTISAAVAIVIIIILNLLG